jgi:lysophospholipase L1-like esterase
MASSGTWTTAYAAALADPADTLPFVPQPQSFRGQTVRQVVRLRRGGTRLRLTLSNQFGHAPLVIDEVTVSAARGGPARTAALGGTVRWEIPPGAVAVSDPVPLPTAAGDEVAVACYAAGPAGPGAYLHSAQRTGHAAPGNQAGRGQLDGLDGAQSFSSLYWITRVLTDAPAGGPVIVALGDSVTRGDGTTVDGEQRYPDHLQARLLATGLGGAVVLNAGLGANRLLRPRLGPAMTDRFDRDVLGVAEATMTPFLASRYDFFRADGNENIRQSVNHAVMTQRDWPVADFAAVLADPDAPGRIAAAYDSGDGVHPSDAGARALAAALDPASFLRGRHPLHE